MESKRHDRRTNQGVIELINKLDYNKGFFSYRLTNLLMAIKLNMSN